MVHGFSIAVVYKLSEKPLPLSRLSNVAPWRVAMGKFMFAFHCKNKKRKSIFLLGCDL